MQVRCTGRKENGRPCGFGREIPDSAGTYEKKLVGGDTELRTRAYCPNCEGSMPFTVEALKTRKTKY